MVDLREVQRWFVGKDFTSDWTSPNFPKWCRILEPRREQTHQILEIGSWEGRSAVFFLEFFPRASITCIDTFRGGIENQDDPNLPLIEERFDRNVEPYRNRVTKMKSESVVALHALEKAGRIFDLVYIDGSHRRDDVIVDSLLTWRLSRIGTVIIWDDYGKEGQDNPNAICVKPAVDVFLSLYAKYALPIDLGYQIVIERRF